jgi:hypothetical protein
MDIVAGALIVFEGWYGVGVGDFVMVEPAKATGIVEEFSLRTTVLRSLNGDRAYVPNSQIITAIRSARGHRRYSIKLLTSDPRFRRVSNCGAHRNFDRALLNGSKSTYTRSYSSLGRTSISWAPCARSPWTSSRVTFAITRTASRAENRAQHFPQARTVVVDEVHARASPAAAQARNRHTAAAGAARRPTGEAKSSSGGAACRSSFRLDRCQRLGARGVVLHGDDRSVAKGDHGRSLVRPLLAADLPRP